MQEYNILVHVSSFEKPRIKLIGPINTLNGFQTLLEEKLNESQGVQFSLVRVGIN